MNHIFKRTITAIALASAITLTGGTTAFAADLIECPTGRHTYGTSFNADAGLLQDIGDDASQQIGNFGNIFPDGIKFHDRTYTSLFLNINGNISFGRARSAYTPVSIPGLSYPTIAPYFSDVDIRPHYALLFPDRGNILICRDVANQRLMFTWHEVGYYLLKTNKRNSYQMILTNKTNECAPDGVHSTVDVQFRYNKLEWTTGDARQSGGSNGLGGKPATAGIDAGDTVNAIPLPGSGTADVLDLVNKSNIGQPGVFEYRIPSGTLSICGPASPEGCEQSCVVYNECADENVNSCGENALCTASPGSHSCTCLPGFEGDGVTCTDIDECADETLNTCSDKDDCVNTPGGFSCGCPEGFEGDGVTCTDIDECADDFVNGCNEHATCTNTDGGFSCDCNDGFSGDGTSCTDIDECADDTLHNCTDEATCANLDGGFSCTCPEGTFGDGTFCNTEDFCGDESLNTCAEDTICSPIADGFVCLCLEGYEDINGTCTDIDECADEALNGCAENTTCTNTDGAYTCSCPEGTFGDGTFCNTEDFCGDETLNTCGEFSDCTPNDGGFSCDCIDGFEDIDGTCTIIDKCTDAAFHTCSPDAVCATSTEDPGYTCECNDGFSGDGEICTRIPVDGADAGSGTDTGTSPSPDDGLFTGGGPSCATAPTHTTGGITALAALGLAGFIAVRRRSSSRSRRS